MDRKAIVMGAVLALAALMGAASPAHAARPVIERGTVDETFFDDFLFDLCGIRTDTTWTERWTRKTFADGSETLHVVRTFVPADRRFPVEKAAGTTFTAPDGTRRVVGKPLHLIGPNGTTVDAGWVEFAPDGSIRDMRGPHPSLGADPADLYCPT